MSREADRLKIKQILTATIVSLCNNGFKFNSNMTIEGLLGITLDQSDIVLININETIGQQQSAEIESQTTASNSSSAAEAVAKQPELNSFITEQNSHTQSMNTATVAPAAGLREPKTAISNTAVQLFTCTNAQACSSSQMDENMLSSEMGFSGHLTGQISEWSNSDSAVNFRSKKSRGRMAEVKMEPQNTDEYGNYDASNSGDMYYGNEEYDVDASYEGYDATTAYYNQSYGDTGAARIDISSDQYEMPYSTFHQQAVTKPLQPHRSKSVGQGSKKLRQSVTQSDVPSPSKAVSGKSKAPGSSKGNSRATKETSMSSSSGLIQRALHLVHDGQLTAGVAIKLFGIPRSTFYKKLSMVNPQSQPSHCQPSSASGGGMVYDGSSNTFDSSDTYAEHYGTTANSEWNTAEINSGTYFVNQ